MPYSTIDDAIKIANMGQGSLVASVFTTDKQKRDKAKLQRSPVSAFATVATVATHSRRDRGIGHCGVSRGLSQRRPVGKRHPIREAYGQRIGSGEKNRRRFQ